MVQLWSWSFVSTSAESLNLEFNVGQQADGEVALALWCPHSLFGGGAIQGTDPSPVIQYWAQLSEFGLCDDFEICP